MPGLRSAARAARLGVGRVQFEAWARRLDLALRRAGGRLELDAPHGASFYELPDVEIHPYGGDAGCLKLRLGRDVQLGRGLIIDVWAGAQNAIDLADRVWISSGTRMRMRGGSIGVGEGAFLRDRIFLNVSSGGAIVLGKGCQISHDATIHAEQRVELADYAGIAERCSVMDTEHTHDGSDTFYMDQATKVAPVYIGANTSIYTNTLVLRGVTIGANALVGAGSLLRKGDYPGGMLYAGIPAKPIRPLGPDPKLQQPVA